MLDKDRVTELVVQSGLHEFGYSNREKFMTALAYFATAIQHEVLKLNRGDAKPTAYVWFMKDPKPDATSTTGFTWMPPSEDDYKDRDWTKLYTNPPFPHPSPDVVAQLVEATKRALNYAENVVMAEGVYFDYDDDLPFIESALAAAKEAK